MSPRSGGEQCKAGEFLSGFEALLGSTHGILNVTVNS